MISGIIFDYGGTLDTFGQHWGMTIWHAYQKLFIPINEKDYRDAYVYVERKLGHDNIIQPTDDFRHTLEVKLHLQFDYLKNNEIWAPHALESQEKHSALVKLIYSSVMNNMKLTRNVLNQLFMKNIPLVLVSNFYGNIGTVLEEMQIADYFNTIIESARVGIRKPDPSIFQLGLSSFNCPTSMVLVVGDSLKNDILPAQSLGCKTALFKGEAWKKEDTQYCIPNYVISNIKQVLDIVDF